MTRPEWFEGDKQQLQMAFANLPYVIEKDFKISESLAVEQYLIEKSNKKDELLGSTIQEKATIRML